MFSHTVGVGRVCTVASRVEADTCMMSGSCFNSGSAVTSRASALETPLQASLVAPPLWMAASPLWMSLLTSVVRVHSRSAARVKRLCKFLQIGPKRVQRVHACTEPALGKAALDVWWHCSRVRMVVLDSCLSQSAWCGQRKLLQ